MEQQKEQAYFEVGAVSKITGLSTNTIRTWERRGFIVAANRSATGRRRYSRDEVDRLSLLKKLTDSGDAISALTSLSTDELRQRLAEYTPAQFPGSGQLAQTTSVWALDRKSDDWLSSLSSRFSVQTEPPTEEPDLIVASLAGSGLNLDEVMERARARYAACPVALIYDYAPRNSLRRYVSEGYFLIRWPAARELLEHHLAAAALRRESQSEPVLMSYETPEVRSRVLNDRQLSALANASPNLRCECPNHMSALVSSLVSFEDYCKRCENDYPREAELHAHLCEQVGKARSIVEESLLYLCEQDNLPIPPAE